MPIRPTLLSNHNPVPSTPGAFRDPRPSVRRKPQDPRWTSRREFLKFGLGSAAALSLPVRAAQVLGANSDIRVAVVGLNGQGRSHVEGFRRIPGVRVVALCDVDEAVLEVEAAKFRDRKEPIQTYIDVRSLLDRKDIDAVTIATPNHWHALITIWACQAGKDVFVEKPVSHNVLEGRRMVEAARKYQRIVQSGTQSRSSVGLRQAIEWIREGHIGKIKIARGLCYKPRRSIGKVTHEQPLPRTVNYNLWCGPAPKTPLRRIRLHYDWHWVWPTGNGDLGNQGVHQMDIARWALGKTHLSPKVLSVGGRLGYDDDGETPNTQIVIHDYGDALLIFEVRGLPQHKRFQTGPGWVARNMDRYRNQSIGHVIECEGGYLAGTVVYDSTGRAIKRFAGSENHYANFIRAVRSRKPEDLNADILEGHLSSALCHTGNISYRIGTQASLEQVREEFQKDPAALETFERFRQHLEANEIDLAREPLTLGPLLQMDPESERFIDNEQANQLLTREYRPPFVLPDPV